MHWDWETGTYMTQHRHFSPRLGRWLSPDPHWTIENRIFGDSPTMRNDRYVPSVHAILQSGNLYMYVMHNPVRWVDPAGTFAVCPWSLYQAGKYVYMLAKPYADQAWKGIKSAGAIVYKDIVTAGKWIQQQAARQERWVIDTFNSVFRRNTIPFGEARLRAGSNMRESLLNTAQHNDLRAIINSAYLRTAKIGDGGTAAMLNNEFILGVYPQHLIKANDLVVRLNKFILNNVGQMEFNDLFIAEQMKRDLLAAIELFN